MLVIRIIHSPMLFSGFSFSESWYRSYSKIQAQTIQTIPSAFSTAEAMRSMRLQ